MYKISGWTRVFPSMFLHLKHFFFMPQHSGIWEGLCITKVLVYDEQFGAQGLPGDNLLSVEVTTCILSSF